MPGGGGGGGEGGGAGIWENRGQNGYVRCEEREAGFLRRWGPGEIEPLVKGARTGSKINLYYSSERIRHFYFSS